MKRVEDLACSAVRSSTLRVLRTHHESYVDAVPLLGPQDVGVESRVRVLTNQVSWASASQSGGGLIHGTALQCCGRGILASLTPRRGGQIGSAILGTGG